MNPLLTAEQVQRLREVFAGHPLEVLFTLALVTGMRREELLHLHWHDVKLEQMELQITSPKTGEPRIVALPADVTALLTQHRARQQAGATWHADGRVFSDETGGPLTAPQLFQAFHTLAQQAGMPHLRFHDLRHADGQALYEQHRKETNR